MTSKLFFVKLCVVFEVPAPFIYIQFIMADFLEGIREVERGTGFIQFLKIKWIGIFLQYLDRLFTILVMLSLVA